MNLVGGGEDEWSTVELHATAVAKNGKLFIAKLDAAFLSLLASVFSTRSCSRKVNMVFEESLANSFTRIAIRQYVFLDYEVEQQRYYRGDTCLFRFGTCDEIAVGE